MTQFLAVMGVPMATTSLLDLTKRSAFWQKNLNWGYKFESGLQGFRMAMKKKGRKPRKASDAWKTLP